MKHNDSTAARVAEFFLHLPFDTRTNGNWQLLADNSVFNIDENTYVNGFICHIDLDYRGMYVLEVVERGTPSLVSHLAVEYGPGLVSRQAWYPCEPRPFSKHSSAVYFDTTSWAVAWMRHNWDTVGAVDA